MLGFGNFWLRNTRMENFVREFVNLHKAGRHSEPVYASSITPPGAKTIWRLHSVKKRRMFVCHSNFCSLGWIPALNPRRLCPTPHGLITKITKHSYPKPTIRPRLMRTWYPGLCNKHRDFGTAAYFHCNLNPNSCEGMIESFPVLIKTHMIQRSLKGL